MCCLISTSISLGYLFWVLHFDSKQVKHISSFCHQFIEPSICKAMISSLLPSKYLRVEKTFHAIKIQDFFKMLP